MKAGRGPGDALRSTPFAVVVAGPSGAGKTTLCRRLTACREDVRFAVSATTRKPRAGEVDGVDYRFVPREAFQRMRTAGELLEWAEVHGEMYGTPRADLEEARAAGAYLLLDIDVQGARSVRRAEPDAVTVFLLPPTGERIVRRLRGRGSEGEEAMRRRLRTARDELVSIGEFDYVVVNDDLDEAVRALEAILSAESRSVGRLGKRARERALALADEIERALT